MIIKKLKSFENHPSIYTLQGLDPEWTFTREQLQVIPTDTEDFTIELEESTE